MVDMTTTFMDDTLKDAQKRLAQVESIAQEIPKLRSIIAVITGEPVPEPTPTYTTEEIDQLRRTVAERDQQIDHLRDMHERQRTRIEELEAEIQFSRRALEKVNASMVDGEAVAAHEREQFTDALPRIAGSIASPDDDAISELESKDLADSSAAPKTPAKPEPAARVETHTPTGLSQALTETMDFIRNLGSEEFSRTQVVAHFTPAMKANAVDMRLASLVRKGLIQRVPNQSGTYRIVAKAEAEADDGEVAREPSDEREFKAGDQTTSAKPGPDAKTRARANGDNTIAGVSLAEVRDFIQREHRDGPFSSSVVADHFRISPDSAREVMSKLAQKGTVRRPTGSPKTGRGARWEFVKATDSGIKGPTSRPKQPPPEQVVRQRMTRDTGGGGAPPSKKTKRAGRSRKLPASDKRVRKLIAKVKAARCTVEAMANGKMRIVTPSGVTVGLSATPSDINFEHQIRRELRKHGVIITT